MESIENLNKTVNPLTFHVMIDIETLDTSPTSIIFSIGYIIFKSCKTFKDSIKYAKRYDIEIEGQSEIGLTRSEKTEKWWKKPENKEAFVALQKNTIPLKIALESLTKDLSNIRLNSYCAKSPNFDFVILENAYKACGLDEDQIPWKFWQLVDVRTVEWILRDYLKPKRNYESERIEIFSILTNISDHDPICDCAKQIMTIVHFDNLMRNRDSPMAQKFIKFELEVDPKSPHQSKLSFIPTE